jgi:hypothetical protein
MANNGRITRGSLPRMLQYGLDEILDQMGKDYKGVGDSLFEEVKTEKAFYEFMQMAGMGIATELGEGEAVSFDSIDQHWVFQVPIRTYQKAGRITRNAIKDNLYEDMLPKIAKEQLKALAHNRDIQQAAILNNATTSGYTFGDGVVLLSTAHPLQTGATSSNTLSVHVDLSEDGVEQLSILADGILNDDGLVSQYVTKKLIVPPALKFEARRIVSSPDRYNTADRSISAVNYDGTISDLVVWKRLSSTSAYFISTDADDGLMTVRREGIFTESSQDPYTFDTILTAAERLAFTVGDWRAILGTY